MVHLEKITEKNFYKVINMKLAQGQEKFVASNIMSLAQAYLYYDFARPFVIMNDDKEIGFIMLDWDEEERTVGIWRFMIDKDYQKKGFGKEAMKAMIKYIKDTDKFDLIHLSYVPTNSVVRNLYYSLGFRETGEVDGDEIVMIYPTTDNPKVGIKKAEENDLEEIMEFLESELLNVETYREKLKNNKVYKITIMGNLIGLFDGINLYISPDNVKYYNEAIKKIKEKRIEFNENNSDI